MESEPVFSVGVPTHARPGPLAACLQGLAALCFPPHRFEVIVSDDGSPISLDAVVAPFRERLEVTLVSQRNRGPAAARNHGATYARGRYLVFLDDDCVPVPTWLTALEERFSATPEALLGGGIGNALADNPFSTATQLIVTYVYDYFERAPGRFRFFNTSNLAVPAEGFRALGGFSESFPLPAGEDYDFCHRWQHAGMPTVYAPEALVLHAHHLTLTSFLQQHFNYGRGLFSYRLRKARRTGKGIGAQPASFYLGLLRRPLEHGQGMRRWLHTGLVAMSQVATAAGALWEAAATMRSEEPTAPDHPTPPLTRVG